jgi:hypothetical protein
MKIMKKSREGQKKLRRKEVDHLTKSEGIENKCQIVVDHHNLKT